ncbi:GDSL esterase/lipase 1-like isoform X3 [Argentina anserina]|uniref:GDSL esterase/lipase 1-like isoform X3 n=1 Tax=Argentina anserina TaxID=57926 RepID=UPI0021765BB7|nr:GDSL esterase/lipase 1-like isoform X3 [Potentilla anserina]
MASPGYPAYCVLLLVTVFTLSPDSSFCSAAHQSKPQHKAALFVFGDSLFDSGNNQYLNASSGMGAGSTKLPYGETYFKHATGRVSDGRIVPDFIAQFANLPLPPPYLEPGSHQFSDGTNFASAGAGVLPETQPGTISLPSQLSNFKDMKKLLHQKLGGKETKNLLGRAVYFFSIGGNDYINLFTQYPKSSNSYKMQYVAMVIRNLTSVVKEVYDLGGRKIAFQNVAPLGCIPTVKSGNPEVGSKCLEEPLKLARLHNRALSVALKKLESHLPGFKYSIFDYYNALGDRVNNPSIYGFKNGTSACCGSGAFRGSSCGTEPYELCSNPSEYVWFDGGHTTETANFQLAELIWSGPSNVTGPYTMKQLFEQS